MKKNVFIDVSKIISKIEKYEYVSFDIFDTLIKRNVKNPKDVFKILEKEYNKQKNTNVTFKEQRVIAEEKSRLTKENGEVTLDEIYVELGKLVDIDIDFAKNLEIKLEKDVCVVNKHFYPIYEACKNKKIIITSDMYLPKKVIEEILNSANIQYFKLYLSNEIRLNKRNGKIYNYILNDLKITNKEIIHIGDNKRGDFLIPNLLGIKALKIPTDIDNVIYYNEPKTISKEEKFNYNTLQKFISNNNISDNIYYKLGYELLGGLLYGYSRWLVSKLNEKGINRVFFLAREGNILKKAFDIVNDDKNIKSEYLYVSRKSTQRALLYDVNSYDDICKIIKFNRTVYISEFFELVGLDINRYDEFLGKYNLERDCNINKIQNFESIVKEILPDIREQSSNYKKIVKNYLSQVGFEGKVAVCDVGWVGTMQNCLQKITNNEEIYGMYIGKSDINQLFDEEYSTSFLKKSDEYEYLKLHSFLNLFESFFLAQHGTTIGYKISSNEKVEPIFDVYEYGANEEKIYMTIQEGALKFINEFHSSDIQNYIDLQTNIVIFNFLKLGNFPNLKDIKLFENIEYVETSKNKFIAFRKRINYFNLKNIYKDFEKSRWKIGFLKKFFIMNFNYYNVYKAIMNIDKKRKGKNK